MSLPRPLIEQDWFRTIATYNPVSYLIEGVRSFVITGWDGRRWRAASASPRRSRVLAMAASAVALRTRLVRT